VQTVEVSGMSANRDVISFDSALEVGGERVLLREPAVGASVTGMSCEGLQHANFRQGGICRHQWCPMRDISRSSDS